MAKQAPLTDADILHRGKDILQHVRDRHGEHFGDEMILGSEMVVDRRNVRAGPASDPANRQLLQAIFLNAVQGCLENHLAGTRLLWHDALLQGCSPHICAESSQSCLAAWGFWAYWLGSLGLRSFQ